MSSVYLYGSGHKIEKKKGYIDTQLKTINELVHEFASTDSK